MDKLEAIKKEYGPKIELDESFNPPRFEVDGKVYSIRDDDGAVGLSRYDGNIKYVYGFHVIRED